MKQNSKNGRILGAVGTIAALAAAGAYTAAVRAFFNLAFERKAVLPMGRLASPFRDNEQIKKGQAFLHTYPSYTYTRTSSDGETLVAHYIQADHAKATFIEFHGWRGSWDYDFSASSPFIHEMGCNLLLCEQRGQGASSGKYMTFGLKERLDVLEWVHWYQQEIDSKIPIIIAGISMGGGSVLMASDEVFPLQVRGILADCGYTSPYEILKHVGKAWFNVPEHPFCDSINAMCRKKMGMDLTDHTALEAVSHANLPILFIHGAEDTFVPTEMSERMYEACPARKELWVVPKAGHGESFLADTEQYMERVARFFEL